jgi:hypothetical protein
LDETIEAVHFSTLATLLLPSNIPEGYVLQSLSVWSNWVRLLYVPPDRHNPMNIFQFSFDYTRCDLSYDVYWVEHLEDRRRRMAGRYGFDERVFPGFDFAYNYHRVSIQTPRNLGSNFADLVQFTEITTIHLPTNTSGVMNYRTFISLLDANGLENPFS